MWLTKQLDRFRWTMIVSQSGLQRYEFFEIFDVPVQNNNLRRDRKMGLHSRCLIICGILKKTRQSAFISLIWWKKVIGWVWITIIGVYCNLKLIGNVYWTLTGCPFSRPGCHRGMAWITRIASLSRSLLTPLITLTLFIFPSFSMINWQITCPWIPCFYASTGYLMFMARYFITEFPPSWNFGILQLWISHHYM